MRKRRPNWLIPLFVLFGIGVGAWSARGPWRVYQDQKDKATEMRKELRSLQQSRVRHIVDKAKAGNPVRMEEEARKQGYRAPGEEPLNK
jgi:hypothetical protein